MWRGMYDVVEQEDDDDLYEDELDGIRARKSRKFQLSVQPTDRFVTQIYINKSSYCVKI